MLYFVVVFVGVGLFEYSPEWCTLQRYRFLLRVWFGGWGGLACLIVVVVAGIVQLRLLTGSCAAQITADIHSKSVYLKFVRSKHSVWILI